MKLLPNFQPPIDATYAANKSREPGAVLVDSAYQSHLNKKFAQSKTSVILKGYMDSKARMNKMLSNPAHRTSKK